uniref:Small ribosomal subunit protein uS3 n=1 Tax='Cocos nucifera' wilt phytoplasma TaxID=1232629 RepID=A0A7D5LTJ6_9MOLU|nr:ribosomal protein S3 [Candidatus Phytoplasma dypsidis]
MGQKSNPNGLRIGINRSWESQWYAEYKKVPHLVVEDSRIRDLINKFYPKGTISSIEIKRMKKTNNENIEIDLYTSKVGLVKGSENKEQNSLIKKIENLIKKKITFNIFEVKSADKVASLVAQNIAAQLQKRAFFRAVQKIAAHKALKSGAKGIKIMISGRLGGSEIARQETVVLGLVPLNTFKANIDYGFAEAQTTYGILGVKTWIHNTKSDGITKYNNPKKTSFNHKETHDSKKKIFNNQNFKKNV